MFVTPLLYQPENQSFIFLILNIIVLLFTICFVQSFSFFSLFLYSIVVIFMCRKIAHGHSYTPPNNTDLTGQTIIVTGAAAAGIGRVSAIEFAKLGAKVIVGIRGQNRAEQVAQVLESEAHVIGTDKIIG
jgi:hypothetical protein